MRHTFFEQMSLWIIKIGLWVIPFLPLYVSSSMLFPFITGKNFAFRIIVEIIFALWVGLAMLKEEYRPRLTPLFKVATGFIIIIFLADFFSPNPYRAFFSNYERMEGFMMLFHLYLYFVMLISVFRKRDWIIFFHSTLVASILVSGIGLLQKYCANPLNWETCQGIAESFSRNALLRFIPLVSLQGGYRVDSTIGNPTYLAAYLLFHIWLLVLYIYQWWRKWWRIAFYSATLIFELIILYFTATRGATLAFVLILVPFLAAVVWFWPRIWEELNQGGKKQAKNGNLAEGLGPYQGWSWGRKCALGFLVASILLPVVFWSIRSTPFIQGNQVLNRLTNYSLQETTVKSRFLIWQMSAKAALERPILGWGQENYYLVFQKYFNPGLFAQEPWFDRSHNVILDWLVHTGFLGLILYLGLFGSAFWMMWRAVKKGMLAAWQGIVLSALFLTYFFQNIFVFDNLNTYLLFFAFLAYTEFSSRGAAHADSYKKAVSGEHGRAYAATLVALVAVVSFGYTLHIKPIKESKALIQALNLPQTKQNLTIPELKAAFEKTLSYQSFGDTEVREQLSNFARGVAANQSFPEAERKDFLKFSIDELRKETAKSAKDVKHMLFLGTLLSQMAPAEPSYALEAERTLQDAVKLSPTKQIIYFQLAQFYLNIGRQDDAISVLKTAWDLDRSYQEAGANLLMLAMLSGKADLATEVRHDLNVSALNPEVLDRLGRVYRQVGDFASAFPVYERLVAIQPKNVDYRLVYAALLANAGRVQEALNIAEETRMIDANRTKDVDQFIEQMKQLTK